MKEIQLTQGQVALVDDEDFEYLTSRKWWAHKERNERWYAESKEKGVKIHMHRVITNAPSGFEVDHINHNGLDNRKENLRVCTKSENIQNSRLRKDNTSGLRGVSRNGSGWKALLRKDNTTVFDKTYKTKNEASEAYNEAAKKYFGKHAFLNPEVNNEYS